MNFITKERKRDSSKKNETLFEKLKSKRSFGFTLIELLAVIIILGVLMIIAVPSVTEYIQSSRKKAYVTMAIQYINGAMTKVNSAEIPMYDVDATYYLPAKCIHLEKGGDSPFGELVEAYIVITYDGVGYDYYWTSRDSSNMGIFLTDEKLLSESRVEAGVTSINKGVGIGNRKKILLVNNCEVVDITETEAVETIPVDGIYVPKESRPEEDYDNYLALAENVFSDSKTFLNGTVARKDVEEIYTVATNEVPNDAISSWDASEQRNGSIKAWVLDEDNDGMYELYLGQERGVIANPNSSYLFRHFTNVTKMDFSNFDTSKVTDMTFMFESCSSLINLDLSNLDTSNVTSMYFMFGSCSELTNLNLSNFNTSKVTNMAYMFSVCNSLTSLDLSSFDTSNVTTMNGMFNYCSSLRSVNLSSFNTSNVTDMSYMFRHCSSLISLDLNTFDTDNVTNMESMFSECDSLTSLNLSSFDTSNVTSMSWMFYSCRNLTSLDVSSFNTSKVTNMNSMFAMCNALISLDLSNFNTSKVIDMGFMFSSCWNLRSLNLSNFDTSKVTTMYSMFSSCSSLTNLDLSSFDTSNVTTMHTMFMSCKALISLDLSNFDISKVTSYDSMFSSVPSGCAVKVKDDVTKVWVLDKNASLNVTVG